MSNWAVYASAGLVLVALGMLLRKDRGAAASAFLAACTIFGFGHALRPPPTEDERYELQYGPRDPSKLLGTAASTHIGEQLVVEYRREVWSWETALDHIASDAETIAPWALRNPTDRLPAGGIVLMLKLGTIDAYGNEGEVRAISVAWRKSDVEKIQWGKLRYARLINLARLTQIAPLAKKPVLDWCLKNHEDARSFCTLAMVTMAY